MKIQIGAPFSVRGVLGRISGSAGDKYETAEVNGIAGVPSNVLLCTPHGTVIKTGIFYLKELTDEEIKRLKEYESDGDYGGRNLDRLANNRLLHPDLIKDQQFDPSGGSESV